MLILHKSTKPYSQVLYDRYLNEVFRVEQFEYDLFIKCLQTIKNEGTQHPVMIELGCAQAAYTKIFNNFFESNCTNICVELFPTYIAAAEQVCPEAKIYIGYVGDLRQPLDVDRDIKPEKVYLKELYADNNLTNIDVLHLDIQGSEIEVLRELIEEDLFKTVKHVFCSLHGTYDECKKLIEGSGYNVEFTFEHPTQGGYGDGLLVFSILGQK